MNIHPLKKIISIFIPLLSTFGVSLIQCFDQSNAPKKFEYAVFKDVQGKLCTPSEEEYRIIFDAIHTYHFPMNTHPVNKKFHQENLLQTEIDEMLASESDFFRKKLHELNKNFRVILIPTTLYEAFAIKNLASHPQDILSDSGTTFTFLAKNREELLESCDKINGFDASYSSFNSYKAVNNEILSYLEKNHPKAFEQGFVESEAAHTITHSLFKEFFETESILNKNLHFLHNLYSDVPDEQKRSLFELLTKTIDLEYSMNGFFLVRSVNTLNDAPYKIEKINNRFISCGGYSLSYGSSLCAGLQADPGACTLAISIEQCPSLCYTIEIDRYNYYHNEISAQLFHIPPIPLLMSLEQGQGELFHSRSKITPKTTSHSTVCGISQLGFYKSLRTYIENTHFRSCSPIKHDVEFLKFANAHSNWLNAPIIGEELPTSRFSSGIQSSYLRYIRKALTIGKKIK